MRWKVLAGALMAAAFLIPATPAAAQVGPPGLDASCQPIERTVYTDICELVAINLDTATDEEVRVLAAQILSAAKTDSLIVVPREITERLNGTGDLRSFLKAEL